MSQLGNWAGKRIDSIMRQSSKYAFGFLVHLPSRTRSSGQYLFSIQYIDRMTTPLVFFT